MVAMATNLHFDILMQHRAIQIHDIFTDFPITILKIL